MYFFIFIESLLLSVVLSFIAIIISKKFNILDFPRGGRKIHTKPIPLLGGLGVFSAFFIILFFNLDSIISGDLSLRHWLGVFVGALFILIGGILDDKLNLSPKFQIIWPVLAIFSVIVGGVGIEKITNPFGGLIEINLYISGVIIFVWLLGMMYTTKLLDGLDGLVSGVVLIGSCIIFLFTISERYYQYDIAVVSLILTGVCFGFLILNWHPAKIFLGESGSLFLGFILGVLSIISGAKIAIALLVMALPIMDVFWTVLRRLKAGKNPFKFADKKHLHHRLLALGLGQRKTAFIYYAFAGFFGLSALFMQSCGKIFSLIFLVFLMFLIVFYFNFLEKNTNHSNLKK